jgi:hypothetical protein
MAVNKIFLDTDGLTVGKGQLVTSGNSVSIANALLVGGNLYAPTLGISGNSSISGALTVAGRIIVSNTQNSSNTTTGSIVTSGGVGIAGNTNIGGSLAILGASSLSGALTVAGTSSLSGGLTVAGNSSLSGALTVAGASSFSGKNTVNATLSIQQVIERAIISGSGASGTINFDVLTQSVLYYTGNSSANWTINIRGNSTNSLNSIMNIGESFTIAFIATNSGTAYYPSTFTIDGNSVTPKYQGGTAISSGNANSIDAYAITIIKTADAVYTVLASQTKFA